MVAEKQAGSRGNFGCRLTDGGETGYLPAMPKDWEQHYRDSHTPWDRGGPAPPLSEWLEAHPDEISGRVMVPGCGIGHDVRAIAAACEKAAVVGLDISPTAVEQARALEPAGSERYRHGDLFDLPEGMLDSFDWVFEHTCFCAIDLDRREDYVRAVWTALRPGGQLLGLFYLDPYKDGHLAGGSSPHGCSRKELKDLFEASGRFLIREMYVPDRAYSGREGREVVAWMKRA